MTEQAPKPAFGEAIQAAMAARGCILTLDESKRFALTLIRLAELGALTFEPLQIHNDDEGEVTQEAAATPPITPSDYETIRFAASD